MRKFIKSSYLFLIFFILLLSKDYLFNFWRMPDDISYENSYIKSLEEKVQELSGFIDGKDLPNLKYAKVLYQNPYKEGKVLLYTGVDDIKIGAIVVDKDGVVGKVSEVYKNKAVITLLSHPESLLQVKVGDCRGILHGGGLYISGINNYCEAKENDPVYISNFEASGENIIVGYVTQINKDEKRVSDKYYINTASDLKSFHYVLIMGGY